MLQSKDIPFPQQIVRIRNFLLNCMYIPGLNLENRTVLSEILCCISCSTYLFIIYSNLLYLSMDEFEGIEIISHIYSAPVVCMAFVKSLNFIFNRDLLIRILQRVDTFWPMERLGDGHKEYLTNLYRIAVNTIETFLVLAACSVTGIVADGLLLEDLLITGYYDNIHGNSTAGHVMKCIWQSVALFVEYLPVSIAFDGLFLYFIAESYFAIERIKLSLKSFKITPNASYSDRKLMDEIMRETIHEHNNVLRFIKDVGKFYENVMLSQFWTATATLIVFYYMLTYYGFPPPAKTITRYGLMINFILVELGLYSVGGQIIIEQTKSIEFAAYSMEWYESTESSFKQAIGLIVLRSQKYERFTIGNMYNLDMEAYLNVVRSSVSIYTMIKALEESP